MASPLHSKQTTTDGIHSAIAYEYADATARLAAVGFVSEDVNKFARQLNDNTVWMLIDISPISWIQVLGGTYPLSNVNPVTIVPDAASAVGIDTSAARSDHTHAIAAAVAGTVSIGDSASEGVSSAFSRADHTHSLPAPGAPEDVTKLSASAGVSTVPARADHKHNIATGTPVSLGAANSEGTATTLARSDHIHRSPLVQTVFLGQATDTSTTSTTFVTLLTQNITTGANWILINFSVGCYADTNARTISFRVTVDGTPIRGCGVYIKDGTKVNSGSIVLKVAVTAASHTVAVQWKTSGGTATVSPVTDPDNQHASLLIQEVSV